MTKGILLAGNASALLGAVEAELAKRVDRYALVAIPNRFSGSTDVADAPPEAVPEKARVPLDWNPGSAVSARALVLAVENRLGHADEAILVCSPPVTPADPRPVDVEVLANDYVKSWLFLTRELTASFRARGRGSLVLVFPENGGRDGDADVLGSVAAASFRSVAKGLLARAAEEPYLVQGFTGGEPGHDAAFASFIFRQLDDTRRRVSGKLHKYGKSGFFK